MFSSLYPEHYKFSIVERAPEVLALSSLLTPSHHGFIPPFSLIEWRQLLLNDSTEAMSQLQRGYKARQSWYNAHPVHQEESEGIFLTHIGFDQGTSHIQRPRCCEFFNDDNLPPFSMWLLLGSVSELIIGNPSDTEPPPLDPEQMFLLSWLPGRFFDEVTPCIQQLQNVSISLLDDPSLAELINRHPHHNNHSSMSLRVPPDMPVWETLFQ